MTYTITSQIADSGSEVFVYQKDSVTVPLNSLYSPKKESYRFLKKLHNIDKHLIIFIGFGNGAILDSILESEIFEKNVHFLFIEPLVNLKLPDKYNRIIRESEKLSYMNYENLTSLGFTKYLSKFISIPVSLQIHPNYHKIGAVYINNCLAIIKEGIETKQILDNTEAAFAVNWIVDPLLNMKFIPKSINIVDLKGMFKGEKAFLIAAGPSLKENMELVKNLKDTHYLFSVGPALRALMNNGISPNFALSIDSSLRNYDTHFKGLIYSGSLIYETTSNSNIQDSHDGQLIVSKSLADQVSSQFFNDLYSFPHASPSVAIYTLQVIAFLGFSEVYLVGQDLALIDGNYYSEGIKHHEGMVDTKVELTVENNLGTTVGSTRPLKIFLNSFETLIKTLPKELKIYNLSKHGAKINGAPYLDPNLLTTHKKHVISLDKHLINSNIDTNIVITDFINKLSLLKDDAKKANRRLERFIQLGLVSPNDMTKVVKSFRKVTKHEYLEKILLYKLNFLFNKIINKFTYMEDKDQYTSADLLEMIKELSKFYDIVIIYIEAILADERLQDFTLKIE